MKIQEADLRLIDTQLPNNPSGQRTEQREYCSLFYYHALPPTHLSHNPSTPTQGIVKVWVSGG